MITVRVPATSANIGPGFDTLGMAFALYADFTFTEIAEGLEITGCDEKYRGKNNLVYTSFLAGLSHLRKSIHGVSIQIKSEIPVSRGLGSSSACIVAGILGAYGLTGTEVNDKDVFSIATAIEGHPDNVSPSLYGGLTASCTAGGRAYLERYRMDERFSFLALIPDFETQTKEARQALPEVYSRADVVYSLSRLGVILKAFENYDCDLLRLVMDDRIHEPYRKKLIPEYEEVRALCRETDSVCFFISGSGPTLMNVIESDKSAAIIEEKLKALKGGWSAKLLKTDRNGATFL